MKRLVDIIFALILLLLVLGFIAILSLITIVVDRYSPIFMTRRIGKNKESFTCIKLQTLKPPSKNTILADPAADQLRLTKLGRIYRDHGWDELPQIINILLGQMSFIGPRPLLSNQLHEMKMRSPENESRIQAWWDKRLMVRPGLSGWHQVHLTDHHIISFDEEYLASPTIGKNIYITVVSIIILFVGKNRYFGYQIPDTYVPEV